MAQLAAQETEEAVDTTKHAVGNALDLRERSVKWAADYTYKASDNAKKAGGLSSQAIHQSGEVQRAVAQRSAEGTAELGTALVDLVGAQAQHNLDALSALIRVMDWGAVTEIQKAYLRASFERAAELAQRYLEVTQSVIGSAAAVTTEQASKAA